MPSSSNTSKSSRSQFISAIKRVGRSKPEPAPPQSQAYVLDLVLVNSLATYPFAQSPVDSVGSSFSGDQHSSIQEPDSDILEMDNMAWGPPPSSLSQGWMSSIFARRNPQSQRRTDKTT